MARNTGLALQPFTDGLILWSIDLETPNFTVCQGTGDGNGVQVPHTANQPVILVVNNSSETTQVTITIKSNGVPINGIVLPDITKLLDTGDWVAFRLSAAHYSDGGFLMIDTSASPDNVGALGLLEQPTSFHNSSE